jgi:DNA-binding transcriptional MerR regulator
MVEFLSSEQVAKRMGVAKVTVLDWTARGLLPVAGHVGFARTRLYDPAAVERFAHERAAELRARASRIERAAVA